MANVNLLEQELISTTALQKNLFRHFRDLQQDKTDKVIGVLSNNKIVGFLANKKFIDDYFEMQKRQQQLEELVDELEDAVILKESVKGLTDNDLVPADKVYKNLNL